MTLDPTIDSEVTFMTGYTSELQSGHYSRGDVLFQIAGSSEHQHDVLTHTDALFF